MSADREALARMLAQHAVEHSDVEECESEARDRDGQWHRCTKSGDHEGDHENEYVGSWAWDEVDDPRKVRRHWLTIPMTLDDFADILAAHDAQVRAETAERIAVVWDEGYETGLDDECFAQRGLSTDSDAHEYPHANPYRATGGGSEG